MIVRSPGYLWPVPLHCCDEYHSDSQVSQKMGREYTNIRYSTEAAGAPGSEPKDGRGGLSRSTVSLPTSPSPVPTTPLSTPADRHLASRAASENQLTR